LKVTKGEAMVIYILVAGAVLSVSAILFLGFLVWSLAVIYVATDAKNREEPDRITWTVAAILLGIVALPFYLIMRKEKPSKPAIAA